MANHKSAEKRARISARRNAINAKTLGAVRTVEKRLRKAITGKNKEDAAKALTEYMSVVGKAAQKGRVPSGQASRKVSRLSKQVSLLA